MCVLLTYRRFLDLILSWASRVCWNSHYLPRKVQGSSAVLVWSIKCVAQRFTPDLQLCRQMELFRQMVNEAIRIGLDKHLTSLKTLSIATYPHLKPYGTDSGYKLCAISRATGILKNHRKLSRKHAVRMPYCTQPSLTTCYGLKMVQHQPPNHSIQKEYRPS